MTLAIGAGFAMTTRAATVTWGTWTAVTNNTAIQTPGGFTTYGGVNFNGSTTTISNDTQAVVFTGIAWNGSGTAAGITVSNHGFDFQSTGNNSAVVSSVGSPQTWGTALDRVLGDSGAGAAATISLTGLTVGNSYYVQFFSSAPDASILANSKITSGGGDSPFFGNHGGGQTRYLIATFTADATSQSFVVSGTEPTYSALVIGVSDTAPPMWASGWPTVEPLDATSFTARAKTDEAGAAYYVVLAGGAAAPSSAQVKAGDNASNVPALKSGSIPLNANTENTAPITGLTSGTAYDVYFVAEDTVTNLQASPFLVSAVPVTPPPPPAPTGLATSSTNGVVSLTWQASPGAAGYLIKRGASSGGPRSIIGSAAGPAFVDAQGIVGTTYYYVVAATNAGGVSGDSAEISATVAADPLVVALAQLKAHITGATNLTAAEIQSASLVINAQGNRFAESSNTIAAVFDLVRTYDQVEGPLWVAIGSLTRSTANNDLIWTIYFVMQNVMDTIYNAPTLAGHEALLNGFKFNSASNFPGPCAPPANSNQTYTATISASYLDTVGRATQGDGPGTFARKPTGCYLAPGSVATVTVPPALVGTGYKIRVGAHSWDFSNKPTIKRLDRSTLLYSIDALETKVASPLGGGIYIEVPFTASNGIVNVQIKNAVRSPFFSAKSFHTTTPAQWLAERTNAAPWADFQSEKFMMQVPRAWIYAMPDPTQLMTDWDAAMDACNDLMGFPHIRGKESFYLQPDLMLRASVFAPGYPAVNTTFSPSGGDEGYASHYLVRGPQYGNDDAEVEFHEQGHGYFFPKFGGETESNVNLLFVPVMNQKFGLDLDAAFRASLGDGNTFRTLDTTAIAWMCTFNFSPREQPMAAAEKAYQLKGHAKFVELARLFGWSGLNAFWASLVQDEENGLPLPGDPDGLLLRLCQSVGRDIRPLFHFWGIYPQNPGTLAADIAAAGIPSSPEIRDRLLYYKTLVPADNAAFRNFALAWWGRKPLITGYWEETDHAMQWDEVEDFDPGGSTVRPNGDIYVEASAADIQSRVQELLDLYYPDAIAPTIVILSPADGATGVPPGSNLVATFSKPIVPGTGNITLKNLTDGTQSVIAVTNPAQVSVAGAVLTLNPAADLAAGKAYAIQIDATAIKAATTNFFFAGITNDTTWNFTTATEPGVIVWTPATALAAASDIQSTGVTNLAGANFGVTTGTTTIVNNGSVDVEFRSLQSGQNVTLANGINVAADATWVNWGFANANSAITGNFGIVLDSNLGIESPGPGSATITLSGLAIGTQYRIQFFADSTGNNSQTISGSGNLNSLNGQFVTGTFTAVAASQVLTVTRATDFAVANALTIGRTVNAVSPGGPVLLTNRVSGGVLSLSWPAGQGWRLQCQTNALTVGLNMNWVEAAGSAVNSTNITIDTARPTVFYRLVHP